MGLFLKSQKVGPLPPVANPYPSRFQQLRRRFNVYGAIVLSFLLLSSLFFPKWRENFIRSSLDIVSELVSIVQAPVQFVSDTVHDAKSISTLKAEVTQLEKELRYLKGELVKFNQMEFENRALKRYLNVPKRDEIQFFTAPIVAIPKGSIKHSLLLGIGKADGVKEGEAVLSDSGVVGRLQTVGEKTSRVRLLTDIDSRIPVYLPRSQERAILAGNGGLTPYLVYIPNNTDLVEGEFVLTSGLGGIFPQGVPVGKILNIKGGIAAVELLSDPRKSDFLQVLKASRENLTEQKDVNDE